MESINWICTYCLAVVVLFKICAADCPSKDVCDKCTDTQLFCESEQIDQTFINNLPSMITQNIVNITIRGGNIPELPANIFGNCSHDSSKNRVNLKHVSFRKNKIKTIHGKSFQCAPNLEKLDLSDNEWFVSGAKHFATFAQLPKLKLLDLTDALKENVPRHDYIKRLSWLFQNSSLTDLRELRLGKNDLLTFTEEAARSLCKMKNLEYLDLRENNMAKITLHSCHLFLYHIDLRNNVFSTMQTSTLKAFDEISRYSRSENPLTVDLRGNKWVCDCHLKGFTKWLKTTKVTVKFTKNMTCHDGRNLGKQLDSIKGKDLVCALPDKYRTFF